MGRRRGPGKVSGWPGQWEGGTGGRGLERVWEVVIYQPVQHNFNISLTSAAVSVWAAWLPERPAFDPDQSVGLGQTVLLLRLSVPSSGK